MLEAVKWKIFYDDGSIVSSEETDPDVVPVDGVLAIVERRANNTVMIHQANDYYYWTGENWLSGNIASLERWLRKELPNLKYGRWTKDSIWREVIKEVNSGS
ncbi:MAG: hypothetical protein ACXAEN_26465 [Candidatus Thorarchaeota archaeon]|jgi:hypothetical protein